MARKTSQLRDASFVIPRHARGDRDFGGHAPRIWCNVDVAVRTRRGIRASVQTTARDTRPDWTTAQGSDRFRIHARDRSIRQIVPGRAPSVFHDGSEPVREFLGGGTRGNEAGTRTGAVPAFNPIRILA